MASAAFDKLTVPSSSTLTTPSSSLPPTPGTSASLQSFATAQDAQKKRGAYKPDGSLRPDIEECRLALQLFLESRMLESEQLLKEGDPKLERLYIATGYGLIQSVKGFMSFEDKDLSSAIELSRYGSNLAQKHRKAVPLYSRVAGLVVGGNNVAWYRSMTPVQKHAELVYAECLAQKAILGIVYSGDWLQFIKEAINMRSCIAVYKSMYSYLETIDAEAISQGKEQSDEVDNDFRSGVYLGMGVMHLVLSLIPGRIVPILELFGYKGERKMALELLSKAGGWVKGEIVPRVSREQEGLRRSLCDMVLLMFHLVMSGFTYDGVDIDLASNVVAWNAARYPSGVFFLFGQGRLSLFRAQPAQSIQFYTQGTDVVQEQFKSLQGISLWELAIAHLALWDVSSSLKCWKTLKAEAGWSKCVYTYGYAACAVQLLNHGEEGTIDGDEKAVVDKEKAQELMNSVPGLTKKIAGKSIPMEKFCSRRAKKFQAQRNRLLLPALELAYFLLALPRAPRSILVSKILPVVDKALAVLKEHEGKEDEYYGVEINDDTKSEKSTKSKSAAKEEREKTFTGYWDDYCLAHFLRGVCLRYVAYPDPYATVTDENPLPEAASLAKESFDFVLANGLKIVYDHHIVYHTHYELGRLESRNGNQVEAKQHIELVLSGKVEEVTWNGRKGKYNLENALNVRAHSALEGLEQGRLL